MSRRIALAAVADLVAVVVFVAAGRRSHDADGDAVLGTLAVAAPFLIGLGLGWLAACAWRRPLALTTGAVVWAVTVTVGMVLRRTMFDRGTAVSFVLVATLVTGVLLVGWRALAGRLARS